MSDPILIRTAADKLEAALRSHIEEHEEAVRKNQALKKPKADPVYRPKNPTMPGDVRWAARTYNEVLLPAFFSDQSMAETGINPVWGRIRKLLKLREMEPLNKKVIELRWSSKAMVVADEIAPRVSLGRVKAVSIEEQETWSGLQDPPDYRIVLSFPFVMLCHLEDHGDLLDRQLHGALMLMSSGEKNRIRKPDIMAFAATLGRFGTQGILETRAVAEAVRNPVTVENFSRYHCDPAGQGLLFAPIAPEHSNPFMDGSVAGEA